MKPHHRNNSLKKIKPVLSKMPSVKDNSKVVKKLQSEVEPNTKKVFETIDIKIRTTEEQYESQQNCQRAPSRPIEKDQIAE